MLTTHFANQALDALITVGGLATVGLSSTAPSLDAVSPSGVANITEPTATDYARVSLPVTHWAAAANRLKATNADISFPAPTSTWGPVGWVVVWSGTQVIFFGDLAELIDVVSGGDQVTIPAGTLSLYLPI